LRVRARLHLFHGSLLWRRGAFEESEAELQAAVDALDDVRLGTIDANPDDVLIEFIALYEAWGKTEKATEYRRLQQEARAARPVP
jgi:hypothetical protein